jgi:hypothetical protein
VTISPIAARAHDHGDLRDALGAEVGLVVEDPAEMLAIGKDIVLVRQVGAARIDQVDARQAVLRRDLLCAQVLLHGDRKVRPALHRGVVAHDHAVGAAHPADAGDDAAARRVAVVHAVARQRRELQERRARIEQHLHALARRQLAARLVLRAGGLAAALRGLRHLRLQVLHERAHAGGVRLEVGGAGIELRFENGHGSPREHTDPEEYLAAEARA